jgi:hypothetical protein
MAKNVSIFNGSAWVSIVGPAGKDGVDGKDGSGVTIKGTAATYPPDAAPTTGDMWLVPDPVPAGFPPGTEPGDGLVWTGTAWNNVGGIRGPKGADGKDGTDGAAGQDGAPGADGQKGADGAPGTAGADGADGAPGQGFRFRGEWDVDETYENYDVVTGGGQTFLIQGLTKTGAKNSDPSNLVLLATKGVDGTKGADGVDGTVAIALDDPAVASSTDGVLSLTTDGTRATIGTAPDGAEIKSVERALLSYSGRWYDLTPGAGPAGADGRSVEVTKSPTQPATAAIGDFWIQE